MLEGSLLAMCWVTGYGFLCFILLRTSSPRSKVISLTSQVWLGYFTHETIAKRRQFMSSDVLKKSSVEAASKYP